MSEQFNEDTGVLTLADGRKLSYTPAVTEHGAPYWERQTCDDREPDAFGLHCWDGAEWVAPAAPAPEPPAAPAPEPPAAPAPKPAETKTLPKKKAAPKTTAAKGAQ